MDKVKVLIEELDIREKALQVSIIDEEDTEMLLKVINEKKKTDLEDILIMIENFDADKCNDESLYDGELNLDKEKLVNLIKNGKADITGVGLFIKLESNEEIL